jgi:hypothetical protein
VTANEAKAALDVDKLDAVADRVNPSDNSATLLLTFVSETNLNAIACHIANLQDASIAKIIRAEAAT